jgi:putative flippase GtrA
MRVPHLLLRNRMAGQAVRFVIVGVINTVVDMGAFFLLGLVPGISLVAAKFISYNLGTTNSFVLNKYWTFSAGRSKRGMREFGVFFALNVPPLVVDVVVFMMLGLWAGSETFWVRMAKAFAAAVVTTAWTFFGSRYLAFRQTPADGRGHA